MTEFVYVGTELELFSEALNWKKYIRYLLTPYLQGAVLEVGAGMGSNTKILSKSQDYNWCCLEPDYKLCQTLKALIQNEDILNCEVKQGTIEILERDRLFEAIIYLDVLEHIERDRAELIQAAAHLQPQGKLIILSPAHQWLFTPFDEAIGHYRRYTKPQLKSILPRDLKIIKLIYLDCVGLLASLANKVLLKQKMPTSKQIKLWDRLMVPLSRKLDPVLRYNLGKSVLLVAEKKTGLTQSHHL